MSSKSKEKTTTPVKKEQSIFKFIIPGYKPKPYDKKLLTAKEKKAIKYLENKTKAIKHSDGTFFEHLYGTFSILKELNQSDDVCMAGLFHSIYGTEFFQPGLKIDEKEVVSYIGEYSNRLVKIFCEPNRDSTIYLNNRNYETQFNLDLLYILFTNMLEQLPVVDETKVTIQLNKEPNDEIGKMFGRYKIALQRLEQIKGKICFLHRFGSPPTKGPVIS